MFDAEQLERNARKAIDAAMAAQINIDLFDDIIPSADYEMRWPDYDSVRKAFEALAEHGMTHALVRLSDELMCETGRRGDDGIVSEISRCLDVARSAVLASNMNATRKNAFLQRVKQWKRGGFMRGRPVRLRSRRG